jgi:hypothetical protein
VELGERLLAGYTLEQIELNGKTYKFHPNQVKFISDFNSEHKYILYSGGRACGKTLALCVKMYLFCVCFPGIRILLGRKTLADLERTTLNDFRKIVPPEEYEHKVKDAVLNFHNGSQIILFGLDALVSTDMSDMKKAEQKLRSLNIGGFFIDQLEEIELSIFHALGDTMRMTDPKLKAEGRDYPRQGNMLTNPANFWAYDYFIENPHPGTFHIKGSMLDNKDNLTEDFINDRLSRDKRFVERYVYGNWSPDILTDKAVFSEELLRWQVKQPLAIEEGCEIYEHPKPGQIYRMGVDPSEGVIDPASISVVSGEGKKVAKFNGKIPIVGLAERVKYLYWKYHKPQIVLEVNDKAGGALLENIKDLNVYRRQVFDYKDKRTIEKLGFKTNHQTKTMLISNFQDLLRKRFPQIFDAKTKKEFGTFVWSDEAREQGAGAQRGYHDDDVMSTLLAFWEMSPTKTEQFQVKETRPTRTRSFQYK